MMRAIRPHLSRSFITSAGSSPSQRFDVTIVGAGIVGLSVARHITIRHQHLSVCVVEKESQIAMHQSSHNSGVIHAGMYYQPGSMRARLCMSGAQAMYRYCDQHQIPYRRVGKLIVATSQDELARLDTIYQRGIANKVPDICMVEPHEISKMEPAVHALRGIWSPHTGIIRFRDVAQSYARAIEKAGHQIITNFTLARVERHSIHPTFTSTSKESISSAFSSSTDSATTTSTASNTSSSSSSSSLLTLTSISGHHITTRYIITCCGLYSDRIAALCGSNRNPTIVPFRGSWLHLKREYVNIVKANIYPVPNPHFPFLGVHLTPTMDGDMLIGPNAVLAAAREGYSRYDLSLSDLCESLAHPGLRRLLVAHPKAGISEIIRDLLPSLAMTQVQRMVPSLTLSHVDLNATTTGVRAQALGDDGKLIEDFILQPDAQHHDILHVRNAPSPAATASITIGEHVVKEAAILFGW